MVVQFFFEKVGNRYTQICPIKNAHRLHGWNLGLMVERLHGWNAALEKKSRVIFDVLHTKWTFVRAQLAQIGGKWAKTAIF